MFERMTDRARQVVVFAQDEARLLDHDYIGTEHLLLALLREEDGTAARVLGSLDVNSEEVRARVVHIVGRGEHATPQQIPFTPRATEVLNLSLREALALGHNRIGTEHLLLGLVGEEEGVACRILADMGVTTDTVRNAVVSSLSGTGVRRQVHAGTRLRVGRNPLRPDVALLPGWLLFAAAFGVGIAIGWAIWG